MSNSPVFQRLIAAVAALTLWSLKIVFADKADVPLDSTFVFGLAWLTCAATGLGVVPFLFVPRPEISTTWVQVGNAVAAGMMLCAASSLWVEGYTYERAHQFPSPGFHSVAGVLVGLMFIHWTKTKLDAVDPESAAANFLASERGALEPSKVLLVLGVMLVHSISEGIGIGVSCHDETLGVFVSTTLFIHNVPEGLAIAIVFLPRGVSLSKTFLWCVFSSVPQPLFAVPAFIFVEEFQHVFPGGLGFAAGAMLYVAVFELLVEASHTLRVWNTLAICVASATLMAVAQVIFQ